MITWKGKRISTTVISGSSKPDDGGGGITLVKPLDITENGTYTANEKEAFNPVTVNVAGKKFTTGTVVFATATTRQTITHNLGVKPSIFLMYMLIPPEEMQQSYSYGWRYWDISKYGTFNEIPLEGQSEIMTQVLEYSYVNQSKSFQSCGTSTNQVGIVTETIAITGYRSAAYHYPAGIEFGWIAIE